MKKLILSYVYLVLCFFPLITKAQHYYWYKDSKVSLIPTNNKFVLVEKTCKLIDLDKSNWHTATSLLPSSKSELFWGIVDSTQYNQIGSSDILYSIPTYRVNGNSSETFLSHLFYVKLKTSQDESILLEYAQKKQATIVYHSKYLPLWYVMSSIGSNVNSLEMANSFYESGLFSAAEPDMWSESDLFCVNDPYFSSQWNLSNTGLYGTEYTGIDVNFCSARSMIPDSSNVVIAVLDQGVQLNHPDLAANIKGSGYDTETHSSPSVVYGNHGTACAGIISAILNNNLCVAGLAANCKIMSISNTLVGNYASRYN